MQHHPELDLDQTSLDIFDLLRRQPGDAFSAAALAAELGEALDQITASVATLERLGLVNRVGEADGEPRFIVSPSAPEL